MVPMGQDVIVPSVAYSAPGGSLLTGTAALAAAADPALVVRNFKRRLGDPTPLVIGGTAYSPAALMAAQLRDVLAHVATAMGAPPASVVLTCPAIWGPYRREHFTEVLRLANVTDYRLVTEPEAAATHYSGERRLGDGEVVAVYDLGGGTFDTTILRMRAGGMEILGTPEGIEHMGGIDFDETVLAHLDDQLDGAISDLSPADPAAARALADIRALCVRAKEDLSVEPDLRLSVPLPTGPREVTISRLELNEMIRPSVRLTIDALRRTISSAGLTAEDLSAVLLAGGSSRIPLVSQQVFAEFGKPVRVTLHPKFTVALGAAAVAATPRPVVSPPPPPAPPVLAPADPRTAQPARKSWPAPAIAAAVAVVVAIVTTLLITTNTDDAQLNAITSIDRSAGTSDTGSSSAAPGPNAAKAMRVYDSAPVDPFTGFIGDAANWAGVEIPPNGATQAAITATPDGPAGIRVAWAGDLPGQFYLQTPNHPNDLSSYVDADGALVFDVVVHTPPAGEASVQVHCGHPCAAELPATKLFRELPVGQRSTVKIPLSCFVTAGLNPSMVDTPFLAYSTGTFDATFADVRWEGGAGADGNATSCAELV
ncbi:hypothetical protein GCM10027436_81370 [Actinophytocola sediminis]